MSDKHATLENRDGFQSKWGFILACIGSAVGMGNIWRFPIMVQQFGGMTFLIPYFLFVLLIGSTGIIEEFALGRWAQGGPVISFGKATEERTGNKRLGEAIGALPIVGSMMLAIGYTVVMSWIFKYCWMGISGSLYAMGTDMATIGGTFGGTAPKAETLGEALSMMFSNGIFGIGNGVWLIVGLVASLAIMAFGVGNGIEKANKVMMPALFFLFVVLGVYICTLPGASEGYKYIFTLKPEGLLNPQVWVFAFGQAFFSLSVAGNGSVIYGSYLPKDEDLPSSARNVALFDTIAALLAAIVIIPAMAVILGDGIVGMKGGPGLMFVYLVNVFNAMHPAMDLSVDGRCLHLHLPAGRSAGRYHVLLGHEEGHCSGGCPRGPHRRQEGHQRLVLSSGQVGVLRSLSGGPDPGRHLWRHRLSLYTI